jgi:hypothetical protein
MAGGSIPLSCPAQLVWDNLSFHFKSERFEMARCVVGPIYRVKSERYKIDRCGRQRTFSTLIRKNSSIYASTGKSSEFCPLNCWLLSELWQSSSLLTVSRNMQETIGNWL